MRASAFCCRYAVILAGLSCSGYRKSPAYLHLGSPALMIPRSRWRADSPFIVWTFPSKSPTHTSFQSTLRRISMAVLTLCTASGDAGRRNSTFPLAVWRTPGLSWFVCIPVDAVNVVTFRTCSSQRMLPSFLFPLQLYPDEHLISPSILSSDIVSCSGGAQCGSTTSEWSKCDISYVVERLRCNTTHACSGRRSLEVFS